ncbi:MAG: glycosyltransferase family 4 protein [Patescibacteria group bacterium]|mgnify:CR=1 FL=1
MKIAIVVPVMVSVPPKKYGGIELIVDEIARGLAARGHMVTVFCAGGSTITGEGITRVETTPYPTSEHPKEHRTWEEKQLRTILDRQDEFDCIHFNYEPIIFQMNIDAQDVNLLDRFKKPVVLTFHNTTDLPRNIEYYRTHTSLYRHRMVFISENQKSRVTFFPNTKVIYNAIPIELFPLEKSKQDYLLFLGRIMPEKGILETIAVAKKVNMPLIIAAKVDAVDKEFFENDVRPLIDGTLIRYVGEVDFSAKIEYLKRARCLLFPIKWEEPFGLVMIEALACGTPVIAFPRGSVPEIITHGVNGYIVDTVDTMVDAVHDISKISSQACRESVEARFTVERMVGEYESLFKAMIKYLYGNIERDS